MIFSLTVKIELETQNRKDLPMAYVFLNHHQASL